MSLDGFIAGPTRACESSVLVGSSCTNRSPCWRPGGAHMVAPNVVYLKFAREQQRSQ